MPINSECITVTGEYHLVGNGDLYRRLMKMSYSGDIIMLHLTKGTQMFILF